MEYQEPLRSGSGEGLDDVGASPPSAVVVVVEDHHERGRRGVAIGLAEEEEGLWRQEAWAVGVRHGGLGVLA